MTELKTLKDLSAGYRYTEIRVDRLRLEAIKWIKEIRRSKTWAEIEEQWESGLLRLTNGDEKQKEYQIWFIKEFFNITEDDLK